MTTSDADGFTGESGLHVDELSRIGAELALRYQGILSEETIEAVVREAYQSLAADAHVTTYLPVLAARVARERLEALAQVEQPEGTERA